MRFKNHTLWVLFTIFGLLLSLQACDLNNSETHNGATGKVDVKVTDAPISMESISSAYVTIDRVELRNSTSGEFQTIYEGNEEMNLLELTNGVTATLTTAEIDTGTYDMMRLYVNDAAITMTDSQSFDLKVPSGAQTGIKVKIDPVIEVQGGLTSSLLLDIDVSKSFVAQGPASDIRGFNFKPVVRAVNESETGQISGLVTDDRDSTVAMAQIDVIQDSVVAGSIADSTGSYTVTGLQEGTYDVRAYSGPNYDTTRVNGVEVTAGNRTTTNLTIHYDAAAKQ